MELALELGMTVEHLAGVMTESEFRAWQRFASKRMLPARRVEVQLARVCFWVATQAGVKEKTVLDYMLRTGEEETVEDDDIDLAAAKEAFNFKPRNKKAN